MTNLEALTNFFRVHLNDVDLRRLARACSEDRGILAQLPGQQAPYEEIIFAAVEAFDRHGAIDNQFWQFLHEARPLLTAKIAALQARFTSPPSSSSPLQLIVTRARARDVEHIVELEFVLRNDGAVAQVIKELHLTADALEVDYQTYVKLPMSIYCGVHTIKAENKGWSTISLMGDVGLRSGDQVTRLPVHLRGLPGGRWAFLWGHADPHIATPPSDGVLHINLEIENHRTGRRSTVDTTFRFELCESMPRRPDTSYCCVLDADRAEQKKEYPILRTVSPGEVDIFQVAVSATKAAKFDLKVDIVTADDTRLSVRYPNLSIWRDSLGDRMDGYLEDGSVFVLGPDGLWRLEDSTGSSRTRRRRF